jgi:hypothetical protein
VRGTERRPLRQGIAAPSLEKEVAVERAAEEEEEEKKATTRTSKARLENEAV